MSQNKLAYIPKLIPVEFCHFFTHVLLRSIDLKPGGDGQIPNAKTILAHEYMFETLQERLWPTIENLFGEQLLPTYAYARLYSNGDILEKHSDRPACEVSVTLQLGRSHHYAWPIYVDGKRFDLGEGDGLLYPGCELDHWRNVCDGPDGYYSGQVFLHYVRKHGSYVQEAGDQTIRPTYSYQKFRTYHMETK